LLIVSKNLMGIVNRYEICPIALVEEFSLGVRLHSAVRRVRNEPQSPSPLVFGRPYDEGTYFHELTHVDRDLTLQPGDSVLACSSDIYTMPPGYFGLLQTRGSLGRLFVAVTCNDAQIEPGYKGKITLEITNHSRFAVAIPVGSRVAQLFLFRCSTEVSFPYEGRYQDASGPTLAVFSRDEGP
jgi:deoxycytidine triphosphate deaminase